MKPNKFFLTTLFLCLYSFQLYSQGSFEKYFSRPGGETLQGGYQPSYIDQSPDGGFIIVGNKGTGIESAAQVLIKTRADGSVQFSKTAHNNFSPPRATQLTDGGVIWPVNVLSGLVYMDPLKMAFARFDSLGQQAWHFAYVPDTAQFPTMVMENYSGGGGAIEFPNGEMILSGFVKSNVLYPWQINNQKGLLVNTDYNGNVIQSRTFSSDQHNFTFSEIYQTPEGGFIVSGNATEIPSNVVGTILFKFDQQHNLVWAKKYFDQTSEYVTRIMQHPDSGLILNGYSGTNKMFFRKIDANGDVVWNKELNGIRPFSSNSTILLPDSTYLLSGTASVTSHNLLINFDQNGDTISVSSDSTYHLFGGLSITNTPDGGLAAVSMTSYQLPNTQSNYFYLRMLKLETQQQLFGCGTENLSISINNVPVTVANLVINQDTGNIIKINSWSSVYDAQIASSDTFRCQQIASLVAELPREELVSVYPNPSSEEVMIRTDNPQKNASLTIYSSSGKEHFQARMIDSNIQVINCSSWNSGIYFYRITNNSGSAATGKFIVNR